MRPFVRRQTAALLDKLAKEIEHAAEDGAPDAIHDLRVAIRRLSRCLRTFAQFYPGPSWKRARRDLSDLLHVAGTVRDRDIALELMAKAGIAVRSVLAAKLQAERATAHAELVAEIRRWRDGNAVQYWRRRLAV